MDLVRRADWGAPATEGPSEGSPRPSLTCSSTTLREPTRARGVGQVHPVVPQDTRGWDDIAYTWLYSPRTAKFYEGRGPAVAGAHTRGYNQQSHAVCVLGNYDIDEVPAHVIDDLAEWADWHGATWGPGQYTPHRQVGETACPGANLLERLDEINDTAADLFGRSDRSHRDDDMRPLGVDGRAGSDVTELQMLLAYVAPMATIGAAAWRMSARLTADGRQTRAARAGEP